jgi:hypothetical protein
MSKLGMGLMLGAFVWVAAPGSAAAQPVEEVLEELKSSACAGALRTCNFKNAGKKWRSMRSGCSQLRTCKSDCRKSGKGRRGACKKQCKKGKSKKACKACRRASRGEKRDCKASCRKAFKSGACKNARKLFWRSSGKALVACAKKAGGACAQDAQALFNK